MYASTDVMACYHCGAYGHVKNSCPVLMRSSENQGQALVDPPSPPNGVGERGESSSPPVRGREATDPSPLPTGGCEMVEPSPPHIGEQQAVGPSSLPTNVPEVVGPSTSTVQDCTDDDMEGFVTVSRKKDKNVRVLSSMRQRQHKVRYSCHMDRACGMHLS